MKRTIDIDKRRPCTWRKLALLGLALSAIWQTVAQAEPRQKYGLDRMLQRAAPGLAARMPTHAPASTVDTSLGYPNYRYKGPVAQAQARVAASMANAPRPAFNPNAFAPKQAAVAPPVPVATPVVRAFPTESSIAPQLLAEAEQIEMELQKRQQQAALREQEAMRREQVRSPLVGMEPSDRLVNTVQAVPQADPVGTGRGAGRLLAGLQDSKPTSPYEAEARRRADMAASIAQVQRSLPSASAPLYPMAASGQLDGGEVSRAIRGSSSAPAKYTLPTYQVYESNGYYNRNSVKSQQNTGDEPGGVYHASTREAASAAAVRNPSAAGAFGNGPSNRGGVKPVANSGESAPPYGE